MFRKPSALVPVLCASLSITMITAAQADWTRFRGPNGTGISKSDAPTEFGSDQESEMENLNFLGAASQVRLWLETKFSSPAIPDMAWEMALASLRT